MHQRPEAIEQLSEIMPPTEQETTQRSSDPSLRTAHVAVDPLEYPGWDSLLAAHPQASIFHGAAWARVLRHTYGHTPVYICRFDGPQLAELLPIMEVSSRWSGRRGVSLPFTDFCPSLKAAGQDGRALYQAAMDAGRQRRWKYLECRSASDGWTGASPSLSFYGHVIHLAAEVDVLFKQLDSALRRGIRKAEAAGLQVDFSSSSESIQIYYALHCRTRRRHGLPPQPFRFFENIQRHVLDAGQGFVATARLKDQPLAAAVFFCHGRQVLYKFGASDHEFQQLRPNNLMMWAAIKHSAGRGFSTMHLGRTSLANEGLRRFKLAFGASEETVRYCQYDFASKGFVAGADRTEGWFNPVFAHLPLPLLRLAGQILYPHLS
jgi:CelD/BcsL family acetyltransferase involved in cellulose biosynthesis